MLILRMQAFVPGSYSISGEPLQRYLKPALHVCNFVLGAAHGGHVTDDFHVCFG